MSLTGKATYVAGRSSTSGLATLTFTAEIPDGAVDYQGNPVADIYLSFRADPGLADWGGDCRPNDEGDPEPFRCRVSNRTLIVTATLRLDDAASYAALQYPGTYGLRAISVDWNWGKILEHSGDDTTTRGFTNSPVRLQLKRASRIGTFNASPEPVKKGHRLTVRGKAWHLVDCAETSYGEPSCWVKSASRRIQIWFDPVGGAPRRLVGTTTTNKKGKFTWRGTARQSGTWSAQYVGSTTEGAAWSSGDGVRVTS